MTTIDVNQLLRITGGVMDSGDGQGCTRSGGCIPRPSPQPRPPSPLVGGALGLDVTRPQPGGGGWQLGAR